MRKIIILFLSFLAVSCSSDSSNEILVSSQNLLGKWYLKGGTVNDGVFENYEHECESKKDFQEFFSNGKLTYSGHNSLCVINDTENSDWILNGNILKVSNENFDPMLYEYFYTIEKLTTTELVLMQTFTGEGVPFFTRITLTRNEY